MHKVDGELKLNSGLLIVSAFLICPVSCPQRVVTVSDEGQLGSEAAYPNHFPRMGQLSFL